jgi:hypothetical protein
LIPLLDLANAPIPGKGNAAKTLRRCSDHPSRPRAVTVMCVSLPADNRRK